MQVIRNGNVLIDGQLKKVDVLFDEKEILDIREKNVAVHVIIRLEYQGFHEIVGTMIQSLIFQVE